jgi:myo-inositol 2-dehydrogenase/D-chiro-inositol 1-dehydrogenase
MRFGVIGAGRIGKIHGANIAARSDSAVACVADADAGAAQALAAATGAKVGTVEEILADRSIDAVAICSPTDTHADLIERAARAGKAIFCEKPVDLSAERVRACLEVVKATGAKLMIGFNRRFDPNFASVRQRIADGAIGAVEIVQITSRDPSPPPVSYIARSGGLFRDMMIHDFDMARFLLGEELISVSAFGSALVDPAIGEAGDVDTAVVSCKPDLARSLKSPIPAARPTATTSASRRMAPWACWRPPMCAKRQCSTAARTGSRPTRRSTSSWSAMTPPTAVNSTPSSRR